MMWEIKHKSGRVLFVTSDEFIADNRRKMRWIVEEVMSKCPKCNGAGMADSGGVQPWGEPIEIECDCMMEEMKMTSREQFESWFEGMFCVDDARFKYMAEIAWQASRAAIEIELPDIEDKKWHSSWHGKFRDEAFWLETRRVLNGHGIKVKK